MIEFIENIDRKLFLILNSWHCSAIDPIMFFVSAHLFWIPAIAVMVIFVIKQYGKQSWLPLLSLALCYLLSDQLSGLLKELIQRYRPSHNIEISNLVHVVNEYRGGLYGFVSSHAANSFALVVLSGLWVRKTWFYFITIIWALLVSYSRVYLGVHYPADIAGGAVLGVLLALAFYRMGMYFAARYKCLPAKKNGDNIASAR